MEMERFLDQVCQLNRQIDDKLRQAARLRKEGRLLEWALMERNIDADIDRLVDLKAQICRAVCGKEAAV